MAQGSCNCCWAFCSVESFADRLCITGEAPSGTIISMEPILDCSGKACSSSIPGAAWSYLINSGSTTCTKECTAGCAPYDAAHGKVNKCHQGKCDSGSNWPKTYKAASYKSLPQHQVSTYQNEIYANGPIETCFKVYSNFSPFFQSNPDGIYTQESGTYTGGHCVKMLGWGTQGSQDYWLLANSWGDTFADKGYFKMARGTNLCNVEGQVSVGYTNKQAADLGLPLGVHDYNWTFEVGNLVDQEVDVDFVVEGAEVGVRLVGEKLKREIKLSEIVEAKSKVVEGLGLELVVVTEEGTTMFMDVWKNYLDQFTLVDFRLMF